MNDNLKTRVTRGILTTLPEHLIDMLWGLYFHMEVEKKDDIQTFRLEEGDNLQLVAHFQNTPKYEQYYSSKVPEGLKPITARVYIKKQDDILLMLLASEYQTAS